jgi:hypothetical protein
MQLEERLRSLYPEVLGPCDREAFLQRWGNRAYDANGDCIAANQNDSIDETEIRALYDSACFFAILEGAVDKDDSDEELVEEMRYVCGSRRR